MERAEVIVIGGGLGGLVAATLLAREGASVRVLERAEHAGGRARSRCEQGFVHNLGAHALSPVGTAAAVLRSLGLKLSGGVVTGRGAYVLQGGRLCVMPRDAATLLRAGALGVRGMLWFARTMLALGERMARRLRGQTVRQWLDAEAPDARARAFMEMFVRLVMYTDAPDLLSADVVVRQLAAVVRSSVMYLDGGWQTLVDRVMQCARSAGVQVEFGTAAARIEHDGRMRAVITADGRTLPASAVVAALPPQALTQLLPEDALCRRWVESAVPVRAACLDLGVGALPHPERVNVTATDAPLYFANHSAYAELAPAGKHVLHLVRYLAPGEDGRGAEPELREFLERIQPGVYARAEVKRFLPNLVLHHDLPGACRVPGAHPELTGLHLVGDFVAGRGILLDAVLESARAAAERIARPEPATAYDGRLAGGVPLGDAGRAA